MKVKVHGTSWMDILFAIFETGMQQPSSMTGVARHRKVLHAPGLRANPLDCS
jgi:hypothetical protein